MAMESGPTGSGPLLTHRAVFPAARHFQNLTSVGDPNLFPLSGRGIVEIPTFSLATAERLPVFENDTSIRDALNTALRDNLSTHFDVPLADPEIKAAILGTLGARFRSLGGNRP